MSHSISKLTPFLSSVAAAEVRAVAAPKMPDIAFGKASWEKYFGDVGEEPPIPDTILRDLGNPCPIFEGKRVKDTHLLVLVPEKVGGEPLTLNLLESLIESPKGGGNIAKYTCYDSDVKREFGNTPAPSSHWVLMTRDVLPDSRNQKYDDQLALVLALKERTDIPYEMPTALDALTSILMHHVRTGERLYSEDPLTVTRCQEKVYNNRWPMVIGRFGAEGISVVIYAGGRDDVGVAALWKL